MKREKHKSLLDYITPEGVKLPRDVDFTPEKLKTIFKEEQKPKGRIKVAAFVKLLKEYGYKSSQLHLDYILKGSKKLMVKTSITVFRDDTTKEIPFIVVMTDKDKIEDEEFNVLLENGVQFVIFVKEGEFQTYRVSREMRRLETIDDIPVWVDKLPLKNFIKKSKKLLPFQNEHHLKSVVFKCHTIIYENTGQDPSRAFDEFTKILLIKIYDEKESKDRYRFCVIRGERPEDVGKRIRKILEEALNHPIYSKIFNKGTRNNKTPSLELELNDFAIYEVVLELQPYSLIQTSEVIEGSDVKGRVYEQVVDRTFRGGLGQYYTPRTIANFMVELLDPDVNDRVLDPACGTGGFFISTINYIRKKIKKKYPGISEKELSKILQKFIDEKIFGIDIYDRVCRVARLNLIMHGGNKPNIFNMNGLLVDEKIPKDIKELFKNNSFTIILSNPPFAGYIKDPKILSKFKLGVRNRKPRSVTKEVLFIEKIIDLLDYGGKAGLVLPLGIFNNPSLKYVREYLFRHVKIIAVIGLPEYAFTHTGTSVKGALLFIEKVKEIPRDYEIFMTTANYVGYDSTGRPIPQNDFPKIIEAYRNKVKKYFINFSEIRDRIDPNYYSSKYKALLEKIFKSPYPKVPLSKILFFPRRLINPKKYPNKKFKYIETSSLDLKRGVVVELKEFLGKDAPSRARYIGKAGDILIPTARESLVGVFVIPPELDGIIVSTRFIVSRPRENVHPDFVYHLLKRKEILELLKRECTGEIVPSISKKSLDNVYVPLPPLEKQIEITKEIKRYEKSIREYEVKIIKIKKTIEDKFKSFLFT